LTINRNTLSMKALRKYMTRCWIQCKAQKYLKDTELLVV
jgi:hypothetical protein